MEQTQQQNRPGGPLHVDLTRAQARVSHAMMLVEDPDELRRLSRVYELLEQSIKAMFGDAARPKV